ncbi:16S rRNA (adenine(1518)-N(6)/adenine(1519)-N(6))-dimethyltransferase RsmA [Hyphococcus sp.]|uniref:16S rRNA (adenine(1518)-N(6)/adenine(1519)-N(6))- dimethyltransferase RsmA n=1 Tax=Hyphococcus sp. TaxID=2038636 RepID=UPI003D111670
MNDPLPPLREVIERYDLGAKKSLGQHFLLDLNMTRKIARAASVTETDHVLEIGPGPGGLTRALLETGARVTAIERDHRCIEALAEVNLAFKNRLIVIEADALTANEAELLGRETPVKIVANLPYNISTELLIKWLKAGPALWSVMALMFQKEVADRILAAPGSKAYGRLSVIAQTASLPSRAFNLPARAFTPPPKVDSTVVVFEQPEEVFPALAALEKVTQAAFSQRRKMLRSSLKPVFGDRLPDALAGAGIEETQRAEELTVEQFKALALSLENSA